ncbi:MAG: NADH:ubiquinone reductase (Na(+)-transporting) subunit C [Bacteroidales bacterium]|nr:NADH:ubiquinone reductase (Na(+)-transporting) subunit C [Bacteroidales bacterium]
MNTNSNVYTVIYTTILVVIVAAILAFAASALKSRQQANADLAKMKTIMMAANMGQNPDGSVDKSADFMKLYNDHITNAFVVDAEGNVVEGVDAFKDIDLKSQFSALKKGQEVKLPVYECTMDDGRKVNILAMYGAGLWGAIWGYVAVEDDNETVAGAIFDHASETPGLGAKIAEPPFYTQFRGKKLSDAGQFSSVKVIKGGANGSENGVDAISGATMTSKAVSASLEQWLGAYKAFLTGRPAAKECCGACEGDSEKECCCSENCEGECDNEPVNTEKDE